MGGEEREKRGREVEKGEKEREIQKKRGRERERGEKKEEEIR